MDLYIQIFLSTLALAFGLLHIILYIYNKEQKENLFFALFLFFYALNTFFDYQSSLALNDSAEYLFLRIHRAVFPYAPIFALLFFYFIFKLKIPKQFWIISIGLILISIPAIIQPNKYFSSLRI